MTGTAWDDTESAPAGASSTVAGSDTAGVSRGETLLASTGLNRLTHHAEVLIITGSSFGAQGRHRLLQEVPIEQPG